MGTLHAPIQNKNLSDVICFVIEVVEVIVIH